MSTEPAIMNKMTRYKIWIAGRLWTGHGREGGRGLLWEAISLVYAHMCSFRLSFQQIESLRARARAIHSYQRMRTETLDAFFVSTNSLTCHPNV
jgi:hypothetical protein